MPIALTPILLTIISAIFILVNFIAYLIRGRIITRKKLWIVIQIWTVVILPTLFLSFMDLINKNDCCTDSAIFSPEHRIGIYTLIILCTTAFTINVFRKNILPPIAELFLNSFLVLGLALNLIFCNHFTTIEEGYLWWLFGNIPIIMLLLIALTENQNQLRYYIEENKYSSNTIIGKVCCSILKLRPIFKYPVLSVILIPVILLLSLFLLLFGQKPDSIIRAFTDTYKHGFSQLDYLCDNVDCGGHFLCSVGANGHKKIVKPIRYGERNGNKIICNRQLLISNAFEDLIQEKFPFGHKVIRHIYNKIGSLIHRHYHIFNNKLVSDFVYFLMKPAELVFLLTLYTFDKKPEDRIALQYLNRNDKEKINGIQHGYC
jgi:hypothetical protein